MTAVALPAAHRRLLLASSRAPEQQGDVITTSADFSPAAAPTPAAGILVPKRPVVSTPDDHTGRLPAPPPHGRSVRDLQIPP